MFYVLYVCMYIWRYYFFFFGITQNLAFSMTAPPAPPQTTPTDPHTYSLTMMAMPASVLRPAPLFNYFDYYDDTCPHSPRRHGKYLFLRTTVCVANY